MLKKSLCGLKQAPRKRCLKFDKFITKQGYSRCHFNHCVYFKILDHGNYIISLLYVDNILVVSIKTIIVHKDKGGLIKRNPYYDHGFDLD